MLRANAPSFPSMLQRPISRMLNGGKRSVVSTDDSAANPTHAQWRETLRRFHQCFSCQADAKSTHGNDGAFPASDT